VTKVVHRILHIYVLAILAALMANIVNYYKQCSVCSLRSRLARLSLASFIGVYLFAGYHWRRGKKGGGQLLTVSFWLSEKCGKNFLLLKNFRPKMKMEI